MTEKKTFKNPEVCPYAAGQWTVRELNGKRLGLFPAHEWDMEVTFTKKPNEIKEGSWVYHQLSGSQFHDEVYVLAIKGAWAWVTSSPDQLDAGNFTPDMVVPIDSLS